MRNVKLHQIWLLATASFVLTPQLHGGLIGFWNFDATSGTTAHDTSGAGINGTLSSTGATFDPGAGLDGGGALSLSSGGYVDMGNNYAFSGAQSFTVQAWIDTTTSFAILPVGNVSPGCTDPTYNNKASAGVGTLFAPPSSVVVNDGQWHQLVASSGG